MRGTRNSIMVFSVITIILMLTGSIISFDGDDSKRTIDIKENGSRPDRGEKGKRAVDYLDAFIVGTQTFYPGDENKEFRIRVTESYDGSEFEGGNQWLHDDLFYVTISIREFMDETGKKRVTGDANPFKGFTTNYGSPYNGKGGYNISGSHTWSANEDGDDFRLNIKNDVVSGEYTLHIKVHYEVRMSGSPGDYRYDSRTEDLYLPLTVESGLNVGKDEEVEVYSPNDVPGATLYAGASRQKIGLQGLNTRLGEVGEIEGVLSFSGNEITITSGYKKAYKTNLIGGTATLYWRIDVKDNAEAGLYHLTLTLSYVRNWDDGDDTNDIAITERSISLKITIGFTPLLSPPGSDSLQNPVIEVDQEDREKISMDVMFTNTGNVDLMELSASLDLTDAKYFYTSDFYYDEDDYAVKKDWGTEKAISEIKMGDSESVTFQMGIKGNIPPGRYIIPLNYDAKYFDTGALGGSSIDVDTDEDEYHDIMQARGAVEPDDKAYVYVNVVDSELDIEASTPITLQPGMVERRMSVDIRNSDGYDLTNLNFTIVPDEELPIRPSGGRPNFESHLVDRIDSGRFERLYFKVDVGKDASVGTYEIPVQVQGYNNLEEKIVTVALLELEIVPEAPEIVVTSVETPAIKKGSVFDLGLTLTNIGGSLARNITVLLVDDDNIFESGSGGAGEEGFVSAPFDLNASRSHTVSYSLKAHKVETGTLYNLTARVQYEDSKGNLIRYSQSEPLPLSLKTGGSAIVKEEMEVQFEHVASGWWFPVFGILFLGVLILLPFIFFKSRKKAREERGKDKGARKGASSSSPPSSAFPPGRPEHKSPSSPPKEESPRPPKSVQQKEGGVAKKETPKGPQGSGQFSGAPGQGGPGKGPQTPAGTGAAARPPGQQYLRSPWGTQPPAQQPVRPPKAGVPKVGKQPQQSQRLLPEHVKD